MTYMGGPYSPAKESTHTVRLTHSRTHTHTHTHTHCSHSYSHSHTVVLTHHQEDTEGLFFRIDGVRVVVVDL